MDAEHGALGDESVHNAVAAISGLGVSPIVRVRSPAHDVVKRALDTGAHGIMVPQINNAEQAKAVVASSRFPPQGVRGQGSAFSAIGHGITIPEYMSSANQTIIVIIQIETREGVENVDEICAVPGVDLIFIGPNDLAQSMLGFTPARGHEPEFVAAIERVQVATRKHGKWLGGLAKDGTGARQVENKYDTVAIATDTRAIQNWYSAEIGRARANL